jgi:hypothetical protein
MRFPVVCAHATEASTAQSPRELSSLFAIMMLASLSIHQQFLGMQIDDAVPAE